MEPRGALIKKKKRYYEIYQVHNSFYHDNKLCFCRTRVYGLMRWHRNCDFLNTYTYVFLLRIDDQCQNLEEKLLPSRGWGRGRRKGEGGGGRDISDITRTLNV